MTTPDVIQQGNDEIARYNRRLLWLAAVCAAAVLAMLAVALLKIVDIAEDAQASADQASAQTGAIREVLARQAEADAERVQVVDDAVAKIAAQQDRALAFHDASVKNYLEHALGLLDLEVNKPENRERQAPALLAPRVLDTPTPLNPAPAPAPAPVPATAPQPAPAPPPCEKAGKSDRCKR